MATSRQDPEVDSLGHLEERIQKAVALVIRLRQEKEAALKELAESQNTNAQLALEIEELRSERKQVRARIEKLLGHIDQLGSAT
jgi:FtsZ-binding cell division protein ZapB